MRYLFVILFGLISFFAHPQTNFIPGYFIGNNSDTIPCFIKNEDWADTPTSFKYKLDSDAVVQTATLETIRLFVLHGVAKYIRYTGGIDRSWYLPTETDRYRDPEFTTETFFLKVMIEGEASLYMFNNPNIRRFYYSKAGGDIEPLIYKPYYFLLPNDKREESLELKFNNEFRKQIWIAFRCGDLIMKDAEELDYSPKSLVNYFEEYNKCSGIPYFNYQNKNKKLQAKFNLKIRPGVNYNNLTWLKAKKKWEFERRINFRIGLEAEFNLSFNNNKWSIILDPNYQYFKSNSLNSTTDSYSIEYNAIEAPIGLRYYISISNRDKIFLNTGPTFAYNLKSEITDHSNGLFIAESNGRMTSNLFVGFGYTRNNLLSIEFRANSSKNLLNRFSGQKTKFNVLSLILGLKLF